MLADLGPGVVAASTSIDTAQVEILAGDLSAAEQALRRDDEALAAMGEQYVRSTVAGLLAKVLVLQGRMDEADEFAERTRELAAEDDVDPQIAWRLVRAKVLAHRGDVEEALVLAEEALTLSHAADNPRLRASVLVDRAEIQARAERQADAEASWTEAITLFERKGDRVLAAQLRARYIELAEP
jgi:ATP/maltotriose-dependent transcriptional regulator MalT